MDEEGGCSDVGLLMDSPHPLSFPLLPAAPPRVVPSSTQKPPESDRSSGASVAFTRVSHKTSQKMPHQKKHCGSE